MALRLLLHLLQHLQHIQIRLGQPARITSLATRRSSPSPRCPRYCQRRAAIRMRLSTGSIQSTCLAIPWNNSSIYIYIYEHILNNSILFNNTLHVYKMRHFRPVHCVGQKMSTQCRTLKIFNKNSFNQSTYKILKLIL